MILNIITDIKLTNDKIQFIQAYNLLDFMKK